MPVLSPSRSPLLLFRLYRASVALCLLACSTPVCRSAHADPPAAQSPLAPLKATAEVQALLDQGRATLAGGKNQEAAALYDQAIARAKILLDGKGETEALRGRGEVYKSRSDAQNGVNLFKRALTTARAPRWRRRGSCARRHRQSIQ